jgi:hypothetical protein
MRKNSNPGGTKSKAGTESSKIRPNSSKEESLDLVRRIDPFNNLRRPQGQNSSWPPAPDKFAFNTGYGRARGPGFRRADVMGGVGVPCSPRVVVLIIFVSVVLGLVKQVKGCAVLRSPMAFFRETLVPFPSDLPAPGPHRAKRETHGASPGPDLIRLMTRGSGPGSQPGGRTANRRPTRTISTRRLYCGRLRFGGRDGAAGFRGALGVIADAVRQSPPKSGGQ